MKKFLSFLGFYGSILAIISLVFFMVQMIKTPEEELTAWDIIVYIADFLLLLPGFIAAMIEHLCSFIHLIMKEKREEENKQND